MATSAPSTAGDGGHVFLSAAPEDVGPADQLHQELRAAGIRVWRDVHDLAPGDHQPTVIRRAITEGALVFLACFSSRSTALAKSHVNAQLFLAIDQQRLRHPDLPWLIPVRFEDTPLPDLDVGAGRTLDTLFHADLFGPHRDQQAKRLLTVIQQILSRSAAT